MKRSFLILSLISSIISVIYVLLVYYGLTRHCWLHMVSSDQYIERYETLGKLNKKIIVGIYTEDPSKLKPVLNSILDQTVRIDYIMVTVPYDFKGEIPESVKKVANTIKPGKDYGENANIVPLLKREKQADTVIILLSDSYTYGADYINSMFEHCKENPDRILYTRKKEDNEMDVKGGILLTPKIAGSNMQNFTWPNNRQLVEYTEIYHRF